MNKLELVEVLKEEAELTKNEAMKVVDLFFDEMSNALAIDDRVEIRGLCSFYVKEYKAYTGRNPKTGEPTHVDSKKLPFFKCGKELKDRVDS
jgi:integration host factor subunit beta